MLDQQTSTADEEFDIFADDSSEADADNASEELTLSELNSISGRNFSSKEEALKHYKHLNSLVGDQKRIETERKAKDAESKLSELDKLRAEMNALKQDNTKKEFLLANPGAKDKIELVEAYADKHSLPLEEAWTKIADKFAISTSNEDSYGVRPKQRITPTQSQNIAELTEAARRGNSDAQDALIQETLLKALQ